MSIMLKIFCWVISSRIEKSVFFSLLYIYIFRIPTSSASEVASLLCLFRNCGLVGMMWCQFHQFWSSLIPYQAVFGSPDIVCFF